MRWFVTETTWKSCTGRARRATYFKPGGKCFSEYCYVWRKGQPLIGHATREREVLRWKLELKHKLVASVPERVRDLNVFE